MRTLSLATAILLAAFTAGCGSNPQESAQPNPTEQSVVATQPPTSPGGDVDEAPVDMPGVPVDHALSAASAYFSAFNRGDADAVMALLPDGAEFADSFSGAIPRDAWEQRLVWNLAQGTKLAGPNCSVPADGASGVGTAVTCESATLNAQIQALAAQPVPTIVSLLVSPNGIMEVREEYGQPDFLQATQPFMEWMEDQHPDDAGRVAFGAWNSIDQARDSGEQTAEYARRWAAYLEANCVYIPDLILPDHDSYLDDC